MAKTVYLHIGTPKSGTTYVQGVLSANKERLRRRDDVLFPGERWGDQVQAARDILDANPHGHTNPSVNGAWQRLVREMDDWPGKAVVSMEWLGSADARRAERIAESLGGSRLEVVITVRDMARTIPAAWQEFLQNWETWTWTEFLRAISSDEPRSTPAGRLFWLQQDLARMLAIWSGVVPPEQIHVVTLPPSGSSPSELWRRFCAVLDIESQGYDASGGANESLGLESTELMRLVNLATRQAGMGWPVYDVRLKRGLAKRGLSQRKTRETVLTIPADYQDWVVTRGQDQIAAVRSAGVHVVGDLTDLEPHPKAPGPQPDDLDPAAILEAAVDGLVFAVTEHATETGRLRRRLHRSEGRRISRRESIKRRLIASSDQHRSVMLARRVYRKARRRG